MHKLVLAISMIVFTLNVNAQRAIIITSLPFNTPPDEVLYLGASANGWNPGDGLWIFDNSEQPALAVPSNAPTVFEGKVTRGNWQSAEGNASGSFLPNRTFDFSNGDTIEISVLSWEDVNSVDDLPVNLFILDDAFFMPELDRSRRIRILLPSDYDENLQIEYPVLYMHDGQNLFSASESFAGEWEVDEAMEAFENNSNFDAIIVAIDHGATLRLPEYTPWANPGYGGGEGSQYTDFIVNTLKPYVDDQYRTLENRENTGIMGSSLGGLISHYAGIKFQNIFSKVGVFSPSFWFTDDIYSFTQMQGKQENMKFYFLAGGEESESLDEQVTTMLMTMSNAGFTDEELRYDFIPEGQHSEWFWAENFSTAFEWLFIPTITGINQGRKPKQSVQVYPNPVSDSLYLLLPEGEQNAEIEVLDTSGKTVMNKAIFQKSLDVSGLKKGIYQIAIHTESEVFTSRFVKL